jgi:hypothetical protein
MNVKGAPLAGKSLLPAQAVELAPTTTPGTVTGIAEADAEEMLKARILGREALSEHTVQNCFLVRSRHDPASPA